MTKYGKGEYNRLFRDHLGCARLLLHCHKMSFGYASKQLAIVAEMPAEMANPFELACGDLGLTC